MTSYFIGIDLGTTICKCSVYDESHKLQGESCEEYPLLYPASGHIEQDADKWWDLTKKVIKRALKTIRLDKIRAISVSSQGISFVPLNALKQPIRNAISWLDERGKSEITFIEKKFKKEVIYNMTGKCLSGAYILPKLLWLMRNEPDVIASADKIVMPMEFITGRLSGNYITDHTMASGTMLYNIHTRCWDSGILDAFGIDIKKLPLISEAGSPAGVILPDVAEELGLPKETLVVVGGQDQKCASLAGGIDSSTLTVSLGTAAAAEVICSSPVLDPAFMIPAFSYLFAGCWVLEGAVATSGAAVKWFKDNWASSYTYAEMDEKAMQSYAAQNNVFFYPYLSSDLNDDQKGVFYGLGLDTGVSDMAMAVLEGITFEISDISKRLEYLSDTKKINKIRVFGGGANSGIWCQLLADVCDLPVDVMHTPETAAQGAAILAGVGAGKYKDAFIVASQLKVFHTFLPDVCNSAIYSKKKADYFALKTKLFDR